MTFDKLRIRFRKAGDLRFVSHHDLMRLVERLLRRAALPFRSTEGFHPKPKMAFASALGLGIVGHQEVLEIELGGGLSEAEIQGRLAAQAPPGLDILEVRKIDPRQSAHVQRAWYRIGFDPARYPELPARLAALLGEAECWVERTRPQPRRVNIRPYLLELDLQPRGLRMAIAITPGGAARPEEVLRLLGLEDLLPSGAVLERTALELDDEIQESVVSSPLSVVRSQWREPSLAVSRSRKRPTLISVNRGRIIETEPPLIFGDCES